MSNYTNKVELLGYYGGDITHGLSAWTSTYRDLPQEKLDRLPAMLKKLAEDEHETPFEKSVQHFLIDMDLASHVQTLKHRVGCSVNTESARYKELKEDKFYIPPDFYNVPVSPELELGKDYKNWAEVLIDQSKANNMLYHACLKDAEKVLGRKRAKESSRFFKMYNSQLTSDVMFNWRSFAHFLWLRRSEQAQKEIYEVADKMLQLVKEIPGNPFKYTLAAFGL
jgi:flavin-dependent thymidylate synthase